MSSYADGASCRVDEGMDSIDPVVGSSLSRNLPKYGQPPYAFKSREQSVLPLMFRGADHWQDILAGSILGLVMAYFSYRQYYPGLGSKIPHRPFAPRIIGQVELLPTHLRTLSGPSAGYMNGQHTRYTDNDQEDDRHSTEIPERGSVHDSIAE